MPDDHAFDSDLAAARVDERWFVGRGPNGGFVAALVLRAMRARIADRERVPLSLTVQYLSPAQAGPLDVRVAVERDGASTTALSARLVQDDRTVGLALASFGRWRADGLEYLDATPPADAAPLERATPIPADAPGAPAFLANYEMRAALGAAPGTASGRARWGGWLRFARPRALDHEALAAYSDAWAPAVWARTGTVVAAPTLDLTIHFRDRLEPAPDAADGWVLGVFSSVRAAGGTWEEDGELWSRDGRLLAQSRQLALVRT